MGGRPIHGELAIGAAERRHRCGAVCETRRYTMKAMQRGTLALVIGMLTALGAPLLAHHGNAAYADDVTEFKQAKVTRFLWSNPHALVDFDAKDAKGNPLHVTVETAAPQALRLI